MKKEILKKIVGEVIAYVVAVTIVQIVAHKCGFIDSSIIDNIIGLTIGFILWEVIMFFINRGKQK